MLQGLTVLERGWLSSNNVLIHAASGEAGATLVDSGHVNHAEQTVQLVRHALNGAPLVHLVNTHLHSDHCGGNAALQAAFGMPISIPPGHAEAVRAWDEEVLSYKATGQRMVPFEASGILWPGSTMQAGGRSWQVLAAPGHDPHSVMLFDADTGVLISADALWENGFGVVFPEVLGQAAFEDVGKVLELIASLPVRVVIPGHGAPFTDVDAALERSRQRLAAFRAQPARHLRYAAKVFIKYHLMEEREMSVQAMLQWASSTPLMQAAWPQTAPQLSLQAWVDSLLQELVNAAALTRDGERLLDR